MRILQQDNIGSHYRAAIYQLMDKELDCDFCFGDKVGDIKKMDYSTLTHKVIEVHNVYLPFGFNYQVGVKQLLKEDYDSYVFIGETRCLSTWGILLRCFFQRNKKVYLWSHGELRKSGLVKRLILKLFYGLSEGALIYNERSTRLLTEEGIPATKLHTIYNSLNYDTQLCIRESLQTSPIYKEHFKNDNKNIVFIGRLTKVKHFDLLIDAVTLLKGRGELVNVTFIGDGEQRQNLEIKVNEHGISEQVWFYGSCYDEQKNAEMIFNADVCVSPGNIGLTAIHVLMFGCPAITNDDFDHQMPEFEAIQGGKTGAFFKAGDSLSLADSISKWFMIHRYDREEVRKACYNEIDTKWNPRNQIRIIKKALGINQ